MGINSIFLLCIIAAVINIPFGYMRAGHRKFSWQWFLAVHFPVPLVIVMRLLSHHGWRVVPLLIVSAIIGQLAGGQIRNTLRGPRVAEEKIVVEPDEH